MGRHYKPVLKYRNKKTEIDGIMFDSKKEASRYLTLKLLEQLGEITNLELQPKYEFKLNNTKICTYRADFRYKDKGGEVIVEDVKGYKTSMYRLKARLMLAFHGITIKET
jgi:hypothetical protein